MKICKRLLAPCLIATLCGVMFPASAITITFDDLPDDKVPVPSGYAGLEWDNFYYLDGAPYASIGGYADAFISPSRIGYNGFGFPATFSSISLFTLNSAYLTAAWNDDLEVTITGLLGGSALFSTSVVLSATSPTLVNFNFTDIDSVTFVSSGGTPHPGYSGQGTHFAIDNIVLNEPTVVPPTITSVPDGGSTAVMLMASLAACFAAFKYRHAREPVVTTVRVSR